MNIPPGLFNLKIKRNGVLLMFLMMTVFGMGAVEGTDNNPDNEGKDQANSKTTKTPKKSKSSSSNKSKDGTLDFHTKMLLVSVSIFMLIFVIVLLVIGHFTWFADIRKKLEEEWEEELKAEEEKRIAKNILSEMINPFEDEERAVAIFDDRRESIDSAGCTRGQCVPPHHSILCPNNPNIPPLNEPFSFNLSRTELFDSDPIDYRNRPSTTDWMNLDSSVKVSEPTPLRERTNSRLFVGNNFSTGFLSRKPPMIPATPDPDVSDMETSSSPMTHVSPRPKFDISKLDML